MLISVTGFIGSGKDTIADYLVANYNFKRESFAGALKDAIAIIFGWDRELLEGKTVEGRDWRERVDHWWADRLQIPHLTPRWVLQYWGTEVCRHGFHDDIWIASLQNKIRKTNENIVISDCRFPNELTMVKDLHGKTIQVQRGNKPEWYEMAIAANSGTAEARATLHHLGIHASETAWVGTKFDVNIINDGTLEELYANVDHFLKVWN
jgi:hypothetical protein